MLPFGVLLDSVLGSQVTVRRYPRPIYTVYTVPGTWHYEADQSIILYYFLVTFYVRSRTYFIHSCFVSNLVVFGWLYLHSLVSQIDSWPENKQNEWLVLSEVRRREPARHEETVNNSVAPSTGKFTTVFCHQYFGRWQVGFCAQRIGNRCHRIEQQR